MLNPKMNIPQIEKQIRQHTFLDGILEIVLGSWLLLAAAYFWMNTTTNNSILPFYILLMLLPLIQFPLIQWLKKRVTYPRIGHAKYPAKTIRQRQWQNMIIALVLGSVIGYIWGFSGRGFAFFTSSFDWVPLVGACLLPAAFLYLSVQTGVRRYLLFSGLLLVTGLGAAALSHPLISRLIAIMALAGLVLSLGGLITLILFVKRYPIADMSMEEMTN
ncbi:MAG: hypothetical protein QNJ45_01890 [Ardenticatenaceae bacterium]|nr:hypothetical protein [Ardenticatenaceae bacterium]